MDWKTYAQLLKAERDALLQQLHSTATCLRRISRGATHAARLSGHYERGCLKEIVAELQAEERDLRKTLPVMGEKR